MVRIHTTHRVFPAMVPGGNGIAGTSVVPDYFYENTPKATAAAMTFRLCIKPRDLARLDHGAMIGPGFFEPVREQFHRLSTTSVQNQKACRRSAKSTYHPENSLHRVDPLALVSTHPDQPSSCGLDATTF
jgi:hypothetical protein